MLEDDYFARKRKQLGMDRADVLGAIQATLDSWYPGQVRARQLHRGVLQVVTPNASVASELRMRQLELIELHTLTDVRLSLTIGTIS
jgi:hypothetical protein